MAVSTIDGLKEEHKQELEDRLAKLSQEHTSAISKLQDDFYKRVKEEIKKEKARQTAEAKGVIDKIRSSHGMGKR